jgi:uncharacterized protein (TIGR00251 family)
MKLRITVKVKPKAKQQRLEKLSETEFIIWVRSPPEKGKANQELIELLASYFKVPKSSIRILRGHTSRTKVLEIEF